MWHETKDEMIEFLKSIIRLDEDQCARRVAQKYLRVVDPDYYEFESKNNCLKKKTLKMNGNNKMFLFFFSLSLTFIFSQLIFSLMMLSKFRITVILTFK